jgi:hypothetical protein
VLSVNPYAGECVRCCAETKSELDALDAEIRSGGEAEMVYRGFSKFLQLDLPWSQMDPNAAPSAASQPPTPASKAAAASPTAAATSAAAVTSPTAAASASASAAATPTSSGSAGSAGSAGSSSGGFVWNSSRLKKECGRIARKMMVRNKAFSKLVSDLYPDHIRLSIHGHTNAGPKYGILLLQVTPKHLTSARSLAEPYTELLAFVCVTFRVCRCALRRGTTSLWSSKTAVM